MKRLVAVVALVLVPLAWMPLAADAAAPTCQGKPATIVGKPGKTVLGTDGPDVVVSGGSSIVSTGDGNDVVCMTGTTKDGYRAKLYSGDGDDSVVAHAGNFVKANLGLGKDTFSGGSEIDDVEAGDPADDEFDSYEDDAADTISTGGGDDYVLAAGNDTVDLGTGDDGMQWHGPAGVPFTGEANGGPGSNYIELGAFGVEGDEPASWVLDTRTSTFSRDGETLVSWTRFSQFGVGLDTVERLLMTGSSRDESFSVYPLGLASSPIIISAGGGDDTINVGGNLTPGELDLDIDGGPGRDLLHVFGYEFYESSLVLDLKAGHYRYHDEEDTRTVPVKRVEDAEVQGIAEVSLRGDSSANRLTVWADQTDFPVLDECQITISGSGGDDRLVLKSKKIDKSWKKCPAPLLRGQGDNDVLVGSRLGERLVGGPGRDVARGGPGRDVCVAETRVSCAD
jgi:hypothetical protein